MLVTSSCTASSTDDAGPGTSAGPAGTQTTATGGAVPQLLFSPEGNNLWAYELAPPFTGHLVNRGRKPAGGVAGDPAGWDVNGQVCFFRDGSNRFVAGEDTGQPGITAGWGIFQLQGATPDQLTVDRVGKLVVTYQPSPDGPDNYGCGVLSDGRILTTDIGNDALGAANGQLTLWFPPFDRGAAGDGTPPSTATPPVTEADGTTPETGLKAPAGQGVAFCKLDLKLATGQSIFVDAQDRVYVTSPRPFDDPEATAGGVYRYDPPFPTAPDAAGGCGRTDGQGSPVADTVRKEKVLAAGDHGLLSPSGVTQGPDGHWFVASVASGTINEYDGDWQFVRTVMAPPADEALGAEPYTNGSPLGLAAGPDGTLYYADLGLVQQPGRLPGPGPKTGSVRRITFTDGLPDPPETMADGLSFPDGLGLGP